MTALVIYMSNPNSEWLEAGELEVSIGVDNVDLTLSFPDGTSYSATGETFSKAMDNLCALHPSTTWKHYPQKEKW